MLDNGTRIETGNPLDIAMNDTTVLGVRLKAVRWLSLAAVISVSRKPGS